MQELLEVGVVARRLSLYRLRSTRDSSPLGRKAEMSNQRGYLNGFPPKPASRGDGSCKYFASATPLYVLGSGRLNPILWSKFLMETSNPSFKLSICSCRCSAPAKENNFAD
jgi:hypothetical protein